MKTFLQFSKGERNGTILLLLLIGAVKMAPLLMSEPQFYQNTAGFVEDIRAFRENVQDTVPPSEAGGKFEKKWQTAYPEPFDPNTADSLTFLKVGLPPWVAKSILKYRSKGGRFKTKDDLKKIYNLKPEDFQKIEPYIVISEVPVSKQNNEGGYPQSDGYKTFAPRKNYKQIAPIEVNTADDAAWETLPGIGPGYSKRIIKFRDALGGFVSTQQVAETFAMPDSVFQKIKPFLQCDPSKVVKIDLNAATHEMLDAHPYLHKGHATQIIRYRERNGGFKSVEELQVLSAFDDGKDSFSKIRPYILIK